MKNACLDGATDVSVSMLDRITEANFETRIEKGGMPALIIFTAPECRPCKLIEADLCSLEESYKGRVSFFRVNTAEDIELTRRLSVVSTPTLVLFINGKPALRMVGYVTKMDVSTRIDDRLELLSD